VKDIDSPRGKRYEDESGSLRVGMSGRSWTHAAKASRAEIDGIAHGCAVIPGAQFSFNYLRQGGPVFPRICLSVGNFA